MHHADVLSQLWPRKSFVVAIKTESESLSKPCRLDIIFFSVDTRLIHFWNIVGVIILNLNYTKKRVKEEHYKKYIYIIYYLIGFHYFWRMVLFQVANQMAGPFNWVTTEAALIDWLIYVTLHVIPHGSLNTGPVVAIGTLHPDSSDPHRWTNRMRRRRGGMNHSCVRSYGFPSKSFIVTVTTENKSSFLPARFIIKFFSFLIIQRSWNSPLFFRIFNLAYKKKLSVWLINNELH